MREAGAQLLLCMKARHQPMLHPTHVQVATIACIVFTLRSIAGGWLAGGERHACEQL
jgi:hypothetical protein